MPLTKKDKVQRTPGDNGKEYIPVKYRGGDKRKSGARERSYKDTQKASGSKRNVLGSGALELSSLANGIPENLDKQLENKILNTNSEIKTLLENLQSLNKKKEILEDEAQ